MGEPAGAFLRTASWRSPSPSHRRPLWAAVSGSRQEIGEPRGGRGEQNGCMRVDTRWARLQRPAPIVFAGGFRLAAARKQARKRPRPGLTADKVNSQHRTLCLGSGSDCGRGRTGQAETQAWRALSALVPVPFLPGGWRQQVDMSSSLKMSPLLPTLRQVILAAHCLRSVQV